MKEATEPRPSSALRRGGDALRSAVARVLGIRSGSALPGGEPSDGESRFADELHLRRLLEEGSTVLYALKLRRGRLVSIWSSENACRVYGLPAGEHTDGAAWREHVHPEDAPRLEAAMREGSREGCLYEYRLRDRSGAYRWVRDEQRVALRAGDEVTVVGSWTDITELKETQEALRRLAAELERRVEDRTVELRSTNQRLQEEVGERERAEEEVRRTAEHFRALTENGFDIVAVVDGEGRIRYASSSVERMLGCEVAEVVGTHFAQYVHPDDAAGGVGLLKAVLTRSGAGLRRELRFRHCDGYWRVFDVAAHNLLADPAVGGVVVNARDVTERNVALERLQQSERDYHGLFVNARDAILIMDPDDEIVLDANPRACEMYGRPRAELVGTSLRDISRDPVRGERMLAQVLTADETLCFDTIQYRADGAELHLEVSASLTDYQGRVAILSINRDVAEHRRSQEALRASEEQFRQLAETIREVFTIRDTRTDHVLYISPAFDEVWGRPRAEVVENPARWLAWVHPDDREKASTVLADIEEPYDLEYRIVRPDGEVRWLSSRGFPVRDATGEVYRRVGTSEDVTERRRAEEALRESQQQLLQSQKMEAVGRLAGGVAHDFNNMLMAIQGHTELLRMEESVGPDMEWHLGEISSAVERAAGLTRQLLAFSRKQVLQPRPISLNSVISEMESMLGRMIGEDVAMRAVLARDLGVVLADPAQLQQVLLNLAVNARDAMPEGGTLSIETANVHLYGEYAATHEEVEPGRYVMLAVSDTGTGMDAATRERVFEPFFTTKEQGKGTGLGLSTVYGIVRQSGGHIWVYSEPGMGTTFRIYFPRTDRPTEAVEPERPAGPPPTGDETVLLVEDDALVRSLLNTFLDRLGYQVLTAANGEEAVARAGTHPGILHLLLTDVVMPGMNGRELARRVRVLRPEARVLYMSGYTDDAIALHGVLDPDSDFVQKPVSPDQLAATVRSVLDAQRRE
ncbi:MAG: PAS domain S-box protein [Gemmatimonadetes bacterium]|nr:PAS domain S-box protein [Gemmatimonadota bacterium]